MPENTIWLVVAVIIAAFVLFIGMGALKKGGQEGINNIITVGKQYGDDLGGRNLVSACEDWLSGNKYGANAFLTNYKIPEKVAPFSMTAGTSDEPSMDCCGDGEWKDGETMALGVTARDIVIACEQDQANPDAKNKCNSGNFKSSDISRCEAACNGVLRIHELCKQKLPGQDDKKVMECIAKSVVYKGSSSEMTQLCPTRGDPVKIAIAPVTTSN